MALNVPPGLETVKVERLHTRLGWPTPIHMPETSMHKPLTAWRMEDDDAPILAGLFAQHAPKRHLEFGTWQGFGTVLCLQHCDATVWTVNLLDGQKDDAGQWCYSEPVDPAAKKRAWANAFETKAGLVFMQTDALGMIGHKIHAENLGHRVCQIYSDSQQWDTRHYPSGFFDSVFVDGGHDPAVVASDTEKALSLVRPGGLVIWHDFCLDPTVMARSATVQGVQAGLFGMWDRLDAACESLFWVDPSWMLVGVKR